MYIFIFEYFVHIAKTLNQSSALIRMVAKCLRNGRINLRATKMRHAVVVGSDLCRDHILARKHQWRRLEPKQRKANTEKKTRTFMKDHFYHRIR